MTHISNQQAVNNLFELPEVKALPDDCTQMTIGDLHANMMLLLYFLVKNGIVEISAENYKELVEIYKKGDNLTKENFAKLNAIIDSLVIKNKQILIRLIGDEVADRGQNDYFIFKLLAKLQQEDINMEIIVSNHGGEFLMRYEGKDFAKSLSILTYQSSSSNHLQELLDKQIIQYEELDKMIKTAYLPNLKLISYSIDNENSISIYTHAPANLNDLKNKSDNDSDWWSNSIYHLAVLSNVEYDVSSIPALIKTIDGINEHFRLRLQNQTATELFQKEQPLERFIWSRGRVKQQDTVQNGYTVSFIHGHTSTTNDPSRVYNLDGQLGKELNMTSGTLKTLISSGFPAKGLIQKSEENSSNNNTLVRKASPLVKENIQVLPQPFGSLKTPVNDKITEKSSYQKPFVEQITTIASGRAVLPIQELLRIGEMKEEGYRGDYQARFIEKVQEKLGDSATDASSIHVRPDLFLKYNMAFDSHHTKAQGRRSYIQVQLEILFDKENPDKIELGLTVGPWFISFKAPGLVACKKDWEHQAMYSMPLVTLRTSDSIFQLMKNLTEYITACNGSMDYDEKKFNEAHFVKYWLEYYRIWDGLPELTKKYLNEYSEKQTFPNIMRLGSNLAQLTNLDALCKKHGVEKEQSSKDSPIVLKSNDIRNLDTLFCEIIQIKPEIVRSFLDIRHSADLVRYMAMKQYGYSAITSCSEEDDNYYRRQYNWAGYEAGLKALEKLYGSVKTPVNGNITEKPPLQKPFVEQTPVNKKAATGSEQSSINLNVNNKQTGLIKFFVPNDKKEPGHKFDAHIQKLQEELAQMLSSLQLAATEALRAEMILAGLIEPLPFETPQLLQEQEEKPRKMKSVVTSAITLTKLIQTLIGMHENNTISQEQYKQLEGVPIFKTHLDIFNYKKVFALNNFQNSNKVGLFFAQEHSDKINTYIQDENIDDVFASSSHSK